MHLASSARTTQTSSALQRRTSQGPPRQDLLSLGLQHPPLQGAQGVCSLQDFALLQLEQFKEDVMENQLKQVANMGGPITADATNTGRWTAFGWEDGSQERRSNEAEG